MISLPFPLLSFIVTFEPSFELKADSKLISSRVFGFFVVVLKSFVFSCVFGEQIQSKTSDLESKVGHCVQLPGGNLLMCVVV